MSLSESAAVFLRGFCCIGCVGNIIGGTVKSGLPTAAPGALAGIGVGAGERLTESWAVAAKATNKHKRIIIFGKTFFNGAKIWIVVTHLVFYYDKSIRLCRNIRI
jgi:hypothetical protein